MFKTILGVINLIFAIGNFTCFMLSVCGVDGFAFPLGWVNLAIAIGCGYVAKRDLIPHASL